MIIDASGAVLGRLASRVAKTLLKGESVVIVNSEKAIVSGSLERTMERFFGKRERGDRYKGPFYPRQPHKLVRRVIRGMLPYKKQKGKDAFKRLKVFYGCPEGEKGEKISKTANELSCKYITVEKICKKLGGKM